MDNDCYFDVMQGDQYAIALELRDQNDALITDDEIVQIEIIDGNLTKTKPEITYNPENGVWEFPLTQQETYGFHSVNVPGQVRVKFPNGDVIGMDFDFIKIKRSASREVL